MLTTNRSRSIPHALRIVNPVHQRWWDNWAARDDEDDGIAVAEEDLEPLLARPTSWEEFSAALAVTLIRLSSDEQVVMTLGHEAVAHFEVDWFAIGCLVRAGMTGGVVQIVPEAVEAKMITRDWRAGIGPNEGWWERPLRWPARYEEFEATADAVCRALRDIIGAEYPAHLQVTGWNNASDYRYPNITAFGVRR